MKLCSLLLTLLLSTSAYGEIYSWQDKSGTTHFASSIDDVPVRYRAKVKPMNYGSEPKSETVTPLATLPAGTTSPTTMQNPPAVVGGDGRGEVGNLPRLEKRKVRRVRTRESSEE